MTIWTSKAGIALAGLLGLGACGDAALPSFGGLTGGGAPVALSQSFMADRAFTLVPPQGFCIDKASLKQRFALMARCDTLGAPSQAAAAPLGVLTVSVTPGGTDALPTPEQTADALRLARVTAAQGSDTTVTFRAEGAPPLADLDVAHWRGTWQVNGQLVSLALFGPKGGRAVSSEGREVLLGLIARSASASQIANPS